MTDLDRLQGAWKMNTLEVDGNRMPVPGGVWIVIEGERFQSLGMGALYEGNVEIDARKKPKSFDLIFIAGPEKGNRSQGIYELNDDDWKICLTVTGKQRPKKFATKPGSGLALETLKRGDHAAIESPEEASAPGVGSSRNDPAPEIEGEWQMVACSADGYPVPASMVKTGRRIAANGETKSYFGSNLLMKARYSVDKSADRYTIDYALADGQSQYGIWQFEGGILHICFATPGKARPIDFTPKKGQGHIFTSWKKK